MTNEQRSKITDLRHQGYGYTAIANAAGLSKDSVKAYCKNYGLSGVKAETNTLAEPPADACFNCGAELTYVPGAKRKKFCCDACRQAWWNIHPEQVKHKANYAYICPTCGRHFTAYGNAHRKYCSHACYITGRYGGRAGQ